MGGESHGILSVVKKDASRVNNILKAHHAKIIFGNCAILNSTCFALLFYHDSQIFYMTEFFIDVV